MDKRFLSSAKHPHYLWDHSGFNSVDGGGFFAQVIKFKTQLHLVPPQRMNRAVPLLLLYAFMAVQG